MVRTPLASLVAILAIASAAAAQDSAAAPHAGSRVRVETVAGLQYTGALVIADPSQVRLRSGERDTITINRAAIRTFKVYEGDRPNPGRGAARGALIGGGIGLVLGGIAAATEDPCSGDTWFCFYTPPGELIAAGVLGGASFGALIGVVVGSLTKSPRWRAVPVPTVLVAPAAGGGTRVSFRLRLDL